MKMVIAGSRLFDDRNPVWVSFVFEQIEALELTPQITEVVSGKARGVDTIGELWAKKHGIPVVGFPADWNREGKAAGLLRNLDMANYADGLIAIWDGQSRGTKHMIKAMKDRNKPVWVVEYS